MEKLQYTTTLYTYLLLWQDGTNTPLPNGSGGTQGLPLFYTLDRASREEAEYAPAVIGVGVLNGQVTDWAGHSWVRILLCLPLRPF
jgi:hypothetical protein